MLRLRIDGLRDYKSLGKIGEGSFSTVYKVQHKKSGKIYALKVINEKIPTTEECRKNGEVQMMLGIGKHPYIVTFCEALFDLHRHVMSLVIEYMDCNILDMITEHSLPVNTAIKFTYQLLSALAHIHSFGLIHRDVKPENCLVNKSTMTLKLADFGSTRNVSSSGFMTEYIATRWYRPPECLLTAGEYGPPLDLWAVGCVLYEMITGNPLFPGSNAVDQLKMIHSVMGTPSSETLTRINVTEDVGMAFIESRSGGLEEVLPDVDDTIIDLLYRLLAYVPEDRITAAEALKHPAFDGVKDDLEKESKKIAQPVPLVVRSAPPLSPKSTHSNIHAPPVKQVIPHKKTSIVPRNKSVLGITGKVARNPQIAIPHQKKFNPQLGGRNFHSVMGKEPKLPAIKPGYYGRL